MTAMKKMNIRRMVVTWLTLAAVTFSCTNLDEELYSDIISDNFFKTDEEIIAALGQAYSSMGGIGNHTVLWSMNEITVMRWLLCLRI
jgi:hypothetical protein